MTLDEIGATRVWVKGDGSAFLLHPDCYAPLIVAWASNDRLFVGRDLYGDIVTMKLTDVVCVMLATPEAYRAAQKEEDDRRQREAWSS